MDATLFNSMMCIAELSRLLGLRFGSAGGPHPIDDSIRRMLAYQNKRDFNQRDLEIGKLCMLARHLTEIEAHDQGLLKHFRVRAHKTRNWEAYFGWRMEVNVAATLARTGVPFSKSESPDFTLNGGEASSSAGVFTIRAPSLEVRR